MCYQGTPVLHSFWNWTNFTSIQCSFSSSPRGNSQPTRFEWNQPKTRSCYQRRLVCITYGQTSRERRKSERKKNTFVLPTRHTSVSLRRPISCVWNKKVILLRDQGKMVKWFFNTKDQSKAEFFRLFNPRSIFLNFARQKGWGPSSWGSREVL